MRGALKAPTNHAVSSDGLGQKALEDAKKSLDSWAKENKVKRQGKYHVQQKADHWRVEAEFA